MAASKPSPEAVPAAAPEATISQLQEQLRAGRCTAKSLVEMYLGNIAAVDQAGPGLRSIIELNPDAMAIAERLDAERSAGQDRGPLHGIPLLIKDNIDTADAMHTSAGSLALAASLAARDASVVQRLRAAGAILLGKTNMSEWANFRSSASSSGWSGRGGQCRNPYVLDRSPSGSSSGSGAAIAANLGAAALGTETDGSITSPAAACALVGIKPTVGLVSRAGIIPISHTQDTAGPMARTVADAALLLAAISGADPADPATAAGRGASDYGRCLDVNGLAGARLGVARKRYTPGHYHLDALFEKTLQTLRELGAVLIDPADVPTEDHLNGAELTVLLYEFKAGLNAYLEGLGPSAPIRSLAELIAWNKRHAGRELQYFGQELLVRAQAKGALDSDEYLAALATCRHHARTAGIDAVMDRHGLDALICPTQEPAWPIDLVNGDSYRASSPTPAAVAGYPHVTVPMGFVFELPIGLSFFGRAWSEEALIRFAYAFEQASRARRPPRYLLTAPTV